MAFLAILADNDKIVYSRVMSINAEIYVGLTAVIFLFTLARHDHSITRTNIFTHKWIDIFLLFNSFLFPDSGKFTEAWI